jgi:hypothetical protein
MPKIRSNILDAEWSDCLIRLRDARALVLRDAESFHEAASALERIGQVLSGSCRNGLGAYEGELIELASSCMELNSTEIRRLFETVKDARNMAVHEGAWARHLSSRLVDFCLILEQAIMDKMKCAEDIMVRQPLVAETWHLIAHVRQAMLANSFSTLPIIVNDRWCLITELMVMRFLGNAGDKKGRRDLLSTSLDHAISSQGIVPLQAKCVQRSAKIVDLWEDMDDRILLVTDTSVSPSRLLGILSAFDLL